MIIQKISPEAIPALIAEHLQKKALHGEKPLFVFSSDIAADSWSEWAVRNPHESGAEAVALEDFTAWDKFKGVYLAGNSTERVCVPALLRKLYIRNLIHQNLQREGGHFLTKIIPSQADDAESAYAFTDWLAKILPSLKLWHEKYMVYLHDHALTAESDPDAENRDYHALFTRYNAFLEENGFFEPSWLTPEFVESKKTIIILYPELLEDFADYEAVFKDAANVIAVMLPEDTESRPAAYKYADSRSELRRLLLQLRALHENGVRWTDIAVSVPDLETYRPYIKREAARYCIPVNLRAGEPLTKNCAGLIFTHISNCYNSRFSYDSVRALLQNEYVPWKEDLKIAKENLVREGSRLRTLCSYEDTAAKSGTGYIDTWKEALKAVPTDERELGLYETLKTEVTSICEAATFDSLRKAWMQFKSKLLENGDFTDSANKILGRCLSELNDIIDIEARYVTKLGLTVANPFAFFLNELNGKTYRPQEKLDGVSVFPYKLSAGAHFAHQFVIDASQRNLEVPFKKLTFLNAEKRKALLGADADSGANAASAFVRLYAKSGDKSTVYFSYAEESFAGFAIAHNALSVQKPAADFLSALDETDFVKAEQTRLLKKDVASTGYAISEQQKAAFAAWKAHTAGFEEEKPYSASDALKARIRASLVTDRHSTSDIVLTQSDMAKFYPCPRKWLLSSILKLHEDTLDTELMQTFDLGNINHKVLELYMSALAKKGATLPTTTADGIFEDEAGITDAIRAYTEMAIHSRLMEFKDSPLVLRTLESQQNAIVRTIMDFLHYLCKDPQKPASTTSRTSISGFGGYKVQGAELKISSIMPVGTDAPLQLFGIIDCLLSSEDGDFVIIDYKNTKGAMPKANAIQPDENGLLGDFQMPMYVTLVANEKIPEGSTIQVEAAYFYAIQDKDRRLAIDEYRGLAKNADTTVNLANAGDFKDHTIALFKKYALDFSERVQKSDFTPVQPKQKQGAYVHVEPYKVCAGCTFKSICRTTFTVGERLIAGDQ